MCYNVVRRKTIRKRSLDMNMNDRIKFEDEFRYCDECGKKIFDGFTCDDAAWFCCEDCMDKMIEDGKMRHTPNLEDGMENKVGGYYDEFISDKWVNVSVFWTCWYD